MIVVDSPETFLLISQHEHAHLASEFVRFWKSPALRERSRYDDLLFAVREHDNGWQELDSTPMWNAELDRPHDFLTCPANKRLELWSRGTHRFIAENPYASALIAQHAHHLLSGNSALNTDSEEPSEEPDDSLRHVLDELADVRDSILRELDATTEELLSDYAYLELVDLISLAACNGWLEKFQLHGYHFTLVQAATVHRAGITSIDPFPFAGVTTFHFRAKRIQRRTYSGDADLARAFVTARLETLSLRLVPVKDAFSNT